jgi:hypothetical protein
MKFTTQNSGGSVFRSLILVKLGSRSNGRENEPGHVACPSAFPARRHRPDAHPTRRLAAEHADAIEGGMEALESLADRLAFVRPPFNLANVAQSADAFRADLILLDDILRIGLQGEHADRRGAVDATMSSLRPFADAGLSSSFGRRGGMNRQTASRAIGRLVRRDMLQVIRRGGLNQGPLVYRVFPFRMG